MRDALDVANYFAQYSGYTKTNLQVLKLTYIAHGYALAILDKPLVRDRVEAWKHGPVIPAIYRSFQKWGSGVIGRTRYAPDPFTGAEEDLLNGVFEHYGKYCGYYLSQITHSDGDLETPWKQCYRPGRKEAIPDQVTKQYYKKLIEQ